MTQRPPSAPSAPRDGGTLPEPAHGANRLGAITVLSHSLELADEDGLIGDRASQRAFRALLADWRERLEQHGDDPLGSAPTEALDAAALDRLARDADPRAARTIELAVAEFADRLAGVIEHFMAQPAWRGVERIVVGGGFKQSDIGRRAIAQAARALAESGRAVDVRPLHHDADDGGLIGWMHIAPPDLVAGRAILAVDIGGTNARCGIVGHDPERPDDPSALRVLRREKWRHAKEGAAQDDLVDGIAAMLRRLVDQAAQHDWPLAPFVGLACPGEVEADGSISRGAQNLPGDWHDPRFHLPRRLRAQLPSWNGGQAMVMLHNDAVVQGLSELPYLQDVERWAVLTIGTGLGNASYQRTRDA